MQSLIDVLLESKPYSKLSSKDFEQKIFELLCRHWVVERQVRVPDRGDGRSGKIDFVVCYEGWPIPIEVDRKSPRAKSIFKIKSFAKQGLIVTKDPFVIREYVKS